MTDKKFKTKWNLTRGNGTKQEIMELNKINLELNKINLELNKNKVGEKVRMKEIDSDHPWALRETT